MTPRVIIGVKEWNIGGPSVFAERLVRGLAGIGWDAYVLITEENSERINQRLTPREKPEDIRFDYLPAGYTDVWGDRWDALIRYLETNAPCIYIMNGDWRNNIVAQRVSERVRIIGMVHADYELEYDQVARLSPYWNAIVAVSDIIHFNVACRYPHVLPRLVTIRNAVPDIPSIPAKPADGPLRIAYCGELRRTQKKLDDMMQVAHGLAARNDPFVLTFIGDGPMRSDLEAMAGPLIDQGKVRFPGKMAGIELLDALAENHVFLLTSEFEGLSIALLEAMSRGCVPVVSELSTQSLVIRNGINSLTATVGDIDGFVSCLTRLASDEALRAELANAAFQTIVDGGYRVQDMLASYIQLFEQIENRVRSGKFWRPRGCLEAPPQYVNGMGILPGNYGHELNVINACDLWPAGVPGSPPYPVQAILDRSAELVKGNSTASGRVSGSVDDGLVSTEPRQLAGYKVIVGAPGGQVSGIDVFSTHLVRELIRRGVDARIVGTRELPHFMGLPFPDDVPVDNIGLDDLHSWPERWNALAEYLESQSPCIYLPNNSYEYSGIISGLSAAVKVVLTTHIDEPTGYEHAVRLGRASNAVVGVSNAIALHMASLDPDVAERLYSIPYGVTVGQLPERQRGAGTPLRIMYAGRLMCYQKRIRDIVSICTELESRSVPFELTILGEGYERESLQYEFRKLIARYRVCVPGKFSNDEVIEFMAEHDVILVTSTFEGLPMSMLEAMANGVVPIVTDIRSGVPDVVQDGVNGFVVPIGDIKAFVDRLVTLQRDPVRWASMSKAAYQTVISNGYRVEDMVDRYMGLFTKIIGDNFVRHRGAAVPQYRHQIQLKWQVSAVRTIRRSLRSPGRLVGNVRDLVRRRLSSLR